MSTRDVEVFIVVAGRPTREISFTLACHPDARFVEGQTFEITAPGCQPVRARPINRQVINRSDGTTTARMLGEPGVDADTVIARLQSLPNVSNIRVKSL